MGNDSMVNEKNVELSIIVPVYNSQKYLSQCINSVLAQTHRSFELILVDDASTDHSGEICDTLAAEDPRIQVIHHEQNKGLSISREDGFQRSSGEWISFIDNDDYIVPDMYECLMQNKSKGDIICVRGEDRSCKEIETFRRKKTEADPIVMSGRNFCDQVYAKKADFGCVGPIWAKIIKRSLISKTLKKVEAYENDLYWVYFEDVLFVPMLFFYAQKIVFINDLYYLHRHMKSNLSSTLVPKEYHYETVVAKKIVLQFFKENGLSEAYREYLADWLLELQSVWYKVWKNEPDDEKKANFDSTVECYYKECYREFMKEKSNRVAKHIKKISIMIFHNNKVLWGKTFGTLYFNGIRKFLY